VPNSRELHEALLDADTFEDLPGKWQAAILRAEQSRPMLRVVSGDWDTWAAAGNELLRPTRVLLFVRRRSERRSGGDLLRT
jgi:hypothetical protein